MVEHTNAANGVKDTLRALCYHFDDLPRAGNLELFRYAAVLAGRQKFGFSVARQKISGLIRIGQLRRIEAITNRERYDLQDEIGQIATWDTALQYIRAGRGNFLPVDVIIDVWVKDRIANKSYGFMFTTHTNTQMEAFNEYKRIKLNLLKLKIMQPAQIDEVYAVLPAVPFRYSNPFRYWFRADNKPITMMSEEFWKKIGIMEILDAS